jgi:hypothetical protein
METELFVHPSSRFTQTVEVSMDLNRLEFELAVQEAVRAELDNLERERRLRRFRWRRPKRPRTRRFRPGRPWWFPFAVVALAVINTILWPIAFGLAVGATIGFFLLLRSLIAP